MSILRINCLILSDNEKNLALIRSTITKYCTPELNLFEVKTDEPIEHLLTCHPHIAVFDLSVKSEQNLAALNRFRQENPETHYIEFVQYRNFSFSHDAVLLNNVDYLPRPVRMELLQESVTRIVNQIHLKEESIADDLQTIVNDNIPVIRQHYLSLLMRRGGTDSDVIRKKFKTLQIDCICPCYTVTVADMPDEKDKPDYEAISFLVLSSMKFLLKSNGYQVYIFFDSDYCINCLIGHDSKNQRVSICDLLERFGDRSEEHTSELQSR